MPRRRNSGRLHTGHYGAGRPDCQPTTELVHSRAFGLDLHRSVGTIAHETHQAEFDCPRPRRPPESDTLDCPGDDEPTPDRQRRTYARDRRVRLIAMMPVASRMMNAESPRM